MYSTEKQRMISGQLYLSTDAELQADRQRAKALLYGFNLLHPEEIELRRLIIHDLFGSIHDSFCIEPPLRCDYGYNINIGKNFYANFNLTILDCALVTIGNNVLIGPNVSIYTAGHPLCSKTRIAGLEYAYPITIGDNVWIGGNVVINPGVSIGENSVIGSGSVLTQSIPANVMAAGNPCCVKKYL